MKSKVFTCEVCGISKESSWFDHEPEMPPYLWNKLHREKTQVHDSGNQLWVDDHVFCGHCWEKIRLFIDKLKESEVNDACKI